MLHGRHSHEEFGVRVGRGSLGQPDADSNPRKPTPANQSPLSMASSFQPRRWWGSTDAEGLVYVTSCLGVLVMLLASPCVPCADPDDESSNLNLGLTLQNQRVYCWGHGHEVGLGADPGESYPDHLSRLLGRKVDHPTIPGFVRPSGVDATLEAVPYFEEHKYGVIIIRGFKIYEMDSPWDVVEDALREIIRRLQDTGAVVVLWERPLWNVSGQLTTTHEACLTGTPAEMTHPDIVCTSVNNETQTAKYAERWGETVFCKIAKEEGAFFLPDSLQDCLEEGEETCPPLTNLHPDLECDEDNHPNSMGYGVLAERMAEYLVGWGLAEYAVDLDKLSRDLPTYLFETREIVKELEGRNLSLPTGLSKMYEMVEYVYGKGFLYTANRTLVSNVLPCVKSILEHWDEIQGMFTQASECIGTLEQEGRTRDVTISKAYYDKALGTWGEYEYQATKNLLDSIAAKCPEPEALPVFCLILLPLLLHVVRGRDR
jgi:hypothetical protein